MMKTDMENDKIQKLQDILKLVTESISREEFTNAFKEVIKLTTEIEKKLIQKIDGKIKETDNETQRMVNAMEEMRGQFQEAIKEAEQANSNTFAQIKLRAMTAMNETFRKLDVQGKMDAMQSEHEAMMKECEAKMVEMDKEEPDVEETPEQIAEKLNGKELLDIEAVANLRRELEALKKDYTERISSIPRGGRVGRNNIYQTLTPDGSNKTFSVPKNTGGIVIGSDFPTVLMEGSGFTVNAARNQITLTPTNAPALGSQLVFIGQGIFNT